MKNMRMAFTPPIATGRTAEIYAWQPGEVLKLFYEWVDLEDVEYEARIARAIHASGLPVPAAADIVHVNGRHGLVYQRVEGATMEEMFSRQPWRALAYARRMAELHAEMHSSTLQADVPSQRQKLVAKIRRAEALPARLRSKTLAALETIPDGNRLCHGDFHPENILVTAQAEVIIDWVDASLGNPLADVARTTILVLGAVEANQIRSVLQKTFVRIFLAAYTRYYFQLRPGGEDEYKRWIPIVAAARLSENIPEVEMWLLAKAEKCL